MYKYDAFISYRHGDPDRKEAIRLDEILRKFEIRVAFDERDFSPQETFLDEMARCVKESQYTIALLSKRYMESFNTHEEAVMQKCIDSRERKRRLIPVYLEPCTPPLWMESLVGIRLYDMDSEPNPIMKLVQTVSMTADANAGLSIAQINAKVKQKWSTISDDLILGIGIGATGYGILDRFFKEGKGGVPELDPNELKKVSVPTNSSADTLSSNVRRPGGDGMDDAVDPDNVVDASDVVDKDDAVDIFSALKGFLSDLI